MELVIFIGLQASGKSTFFRTHLAARHQLVSKDQLRNNKNRAIRQAHLLENALQAGISVVVDNTNPTLEERALLIQLGYKYDAQIIGYYFESLLSYCLERNRQREGKARVPDVAIYATMKKLVRPSYVEGFHKLFYASMADNGDFDVCVWNEDEVIHG